MKITLFLATSFMTLSSFASVDKPVTRFRSFDVKDREFICGYAAVPVRGQCTEAVGEGFACCDTEVIGEQCTQGLVNAQATILAWNEARQMARYVAELEMIFPCP